MHVVIRQDHAVDSTRRDELALRIELGLLPTLGDIPGFVAGGVVVLAAGMVATCLIWSDREGAEAGAKHVAAWVRHEVAALVDGAPEEAIGEVRSLAGRAARFAADAKPAPDKSDMEDRAMATQTTTVPATVPATTVPDGTATAQAAGRPGARDGQVAELTLMAPFKPGGAAQLRALLQRSAAGLAEAANGVGTLHDMRWVIFDNDTRVLFATTYDGDWDAYIDDFATKLGAPLDAHFAMVEGYPGIASPTIKDWIAQHQITADGWFCAYPDATVRQIWKGQQVLQAFEALLDTASS